MKRTDLAKNVGLKINSKIKQPTSGLADKEAPAIDRREQRKLDQARGLIPFAVKLNSDLVKQIQALAQTQKIELNEVVAELLKKGLDAKTGN